MNKLKQKQKQKQKQEAPLVRVGIFIDPSVNPFTNGAIQQALFIYQCLNNDYLQENNVFFFAAADKISNGRNILAGRPVLPIQMIIKKNIDVFLTVSLIPFKIFEQLHNLNISIVMYECGHIQHVLVEDVVFDKHNYSILYPDKLDAVRKHVSAICAIPNYTHHLSVYRALFHTRHTFEAPYTWGPDFIQAFEAQENNPAGISASLSLSCETRYNTPITHIIIAEPNMQTTKTCVTPLLICNELFRKYQHAGHSDPSCIKIMLLCQPRTNAFDRFLKSLCVHQQVECYDRIMFPDVLRQLKAQRANVIVLSHHNENPLNFLHLEVLYLGYPLVHNTEHYIKAGYYYDGSVDCGVASLERAMLHDPVGNKGDEYRERANTALFRYNPNNPFVRRQYAHLARVLLDVKRPPIPTKCV